MKEIGYSSDIHWATYDVPGQPQEKKPIFMEDAWGNVAFLAYDLQRRLRIGYFNGNTFVEIDHDESTPDDIKDKTIYCKCRKRYQSPVESAKRIYANLEQSSPNDYKQKLMDPLRYGPSVIPMDKITKSNDYEIKGGLGVWPYIPVQIIAALEANNIDIPYLTITEGEKKAIVACNNKMWVVAIPGIKVWKPKNESYMHQDIAEVIRTKRPATIMFLTDGDTLDINYTDMHKDLEKRPKDFYDAMEAYKMHIETLRTQINMGERIPQISSEEE